MKTDISKALEGQRLLQSYERTLRVANRSEQTIRNYVRGIRTLMEFHGTLPYELEIDQVIDFLNDLQVQKKAQLAHYQNLCGCLALVLSAYGRSGRTGYENPISQGKAIPATNT